LTVLVAFNNRSFAGGEAATLELWNNIFNTEHFTDGPFQGSVRDYFAAQSYGAFNVVFDLVYVQVSGDAKKYASTDEDDENSQYLVQDIMDTLKTRDIDWGKYDWNGDDYINQLLIVYAGKGMHDAGGTDKIWPHQWWLSEHLKDLQQGVHCEPIPVSAGENNYLVDCYCVMNELGKDGDYGSFGVICHEYTHCFGFPDFYYSGGSTLSRGT
jgi:M6 family metalloprotease-like protein